jgi:elongation factor P
VVQTKIRNLITGKVLDRNFQPSDNFEETEIEKKEAIFIYSSRGECWFHEVGNPKNRFSLKQEVIGEAAQFLKKEIAVMTKIFKEKIIGVSLPVKIDLRVAEAPPAVRGNTAQGGNKTVTLETGAKISVPLFVNEDDIVRINTETCQYVERVEKS